MCLTVGDPHDEPCNNGHGKMSAETKKGGGESKRDQADDDDRFTTFFVRHHSPDVAGETIVNFLSITS